MGGYHAALTDDLTSLFSNPAGFQSVEPVLRISQTTFGLSGPLFDIAGIVMDVLAGADFAGCSAFSPQPHTTIASATSAAATFLFMSFASSP